MKRKKDNYGRKVFKSKLQLKDEEKIIIEQLCVSSRALYNRARYAMEEYRKEKLNSFKEQGVTNKKAYWPTYAKLDLYLKNNPSTLKTYRRLNSACAQLIIFRLCNNFKSFYAICKDLKEHTNKYSHFHRKDGSHASPSPPGYIKENMFNLIYDKRCFSICNGQFLLSSNTKKRISTPVPEFLLDKEVVMIEVVPKNKEFYINFVYKDKQEYKQIEKNNNVMAIDLGLDNLCTVVTNIHTRPFIIKGLQLKSINQYYNKNVKKHQALLDNGQGQYWSKKLQKLTNMRNNKVNYYIHHVSKFIKEFCLKYNISTIIIGHVAKSFNSINLGKVNNQNFIGLPLGKLADIIESKVKPYNIILKKIDESCTSKSSFIDNDYLPQTYEDYLRDKKSGKLIVFSGVRGQKKTLDKLKTEKSRKNHLGRGQYRTKSGIIINSDVNGAYNILRKYKEDFQYNPVWNHHQTFVPVVINIFERKNINHILAKLK